MGPLMQTVFILVFSKALVNGDYMILVGVQGYDNPTNTGEDRGSANCCDGSRSGSGACSPTRRCDNQFSFCLKNRNSNTDGTDDCVSSIITSPGVNSDAAQINFNGPTWLGLDNPLSLNGISIAWQGAQVYIEVNDVDEANLELVDSWGLNGAPPTPTTNGLPVGPITQSTPYTGRYGFAELTMTFQVVCAEFFSGEFCENLNECESQNINCSLRGTCNDETNGYDCDCDPGFTGPDCEIDINNDCALTTCSENGFCTDLVNGFSCVCNPDFTGPECELTIDDCVGVDCGNGSCVDMVSDYICNCVPGFTGDNCEININDCAVTNCSENGFCMDLVNGFLCVCNPDFTGPECELTIDDCVGVDCGNGSCVDLVTDYSCQCDPGFSGTPCEPILTGGSTDGAAAIAGGIVGGFLGLALILILVVIIILVIKNQRISYNVSSEKVGPGDNPVYGMSGDNQFTSTYEVDFDNPIYNSTDGVQDPTYTSVEQSPEGNNQFPSNYEVDFDNPIYDSTDGVQDPTYTSVEQSPEGNSEYANIPQNNEVENFYEFPSQ